MEEADLLGLGDDTPCRDPFSSLPDPFASQPPPAPVAEAQSTGEVAVPNEIAEHVREDTRPRLHFFISCADFHAQLATSKSGAQTFVKNTWSSFMNASSNSDPLGMPSSNQDVRIQLRVSEEIPILEEDEAQDSLPLLDEEVVYSDTQKSPDPNFIVGMCVRCQDPARFNRHVQIILSIPDENNNSTTFGFATTTFQEMWLVATGGEFSQTMKLPVSSNYMEGGMVEIRFLNLTPQEHPLFQAYDNMLKGFLFYPSPQHRRAMSISGERNGSTSALSGAKLAVEEASEVEWSAKIPLQLLRVCERELGQMLTSWKQRYTQVRCVRRRFFTSDQEALEHGFNVYRIQVISGRRFEDGHQRSASVSDTNILGVPGTSSNSLSNSGRNMLLNRLKASSTRASVEREDTSHTNAYAIVKYSDGSGDMPEVVVGRTNTEYGTTTPVFSTNAHASTRCQHNKPSTNYWVSPTLPSHTSTNEENNLTQFVFYRPNVSDKDALSGWVRVQIVNELYSYMGGLETELMGELTLPFESIASVMESRREEVEGGMYVQSRSLVDWFDVRNTETDQVRGQVQLRLQVLLSEKDVQVESSNESLDSEMPLEFLFPHVVKLQQLEAHVNDMIRTCERLVGEGQTFKSSLLKHDKEMQALPTNLHVAFYRIFRDLSPDSPLLSATKDQSADGKQPAEGRIRRSSSVFSTVHANMEEAKKLPETHVTVTCGAPTAHAMGVSDQGLHEMEMEISALQTLLNKYDPRVLQSAMQDRRKTRVFDVPHPRSIVTEEAAAESRYGLIPLHEELEVTAQEEEEEEVPVKKKNVGFLAVKAVTGKFPSYRKKTTAPKVETEKRRIQYPRMGKDTKVDPSHHKSPDDALHSAVQMSGKLEMLRLEYYLRKSVTVAQSVSGLVTSFVAKLDLSIQQENVEMLTQLSKAGFLVGWESLISSHGKELRMISDAWVATKSLETFAFQLVEGDKDEILLVEREHVGYTIRVPVPSASFKTLPVALQRGELIHVTSVLFTQGINEMQSLANMVGTAGVSIQAKINRSSFRSILEYYNRLKAKGCSCFDASVGSHPDEILRHLRSSVEGEDSSAKNTTILFHAADAVRALHGGRITYCKSGKDRTAMSVTLEQARLLVQRKKQVLFEIERGASDGGPLEEVKDIANVLREFGVRLEIARKNVGAPTYSFNSLQRKLLPEIYRPPMSTIQNMVTSVTKRDS